MSDVFKIGLRLFLITIIAAVCLGVTHLVTKDPIELQKIEAINQAKKAVLPQADSFSDIGVQLDSAEQGGTKILEIDAGKSSEDTIGYVFKVTARGFGGDIEIIVGINDLGEVEGIQIGSHGETPGLGAKIKEDFFTEQYQGQKSHSPISVTKGTAQAQEVEAITGATITTDSVTDGVNLALKYYRDILQDGGGK